MGESSSGGGGASGSSLLLLLSPRNALIVVIVVVSQVCALWWASSAVHDKQQQVDLSTTTSALFFGRRESCPTTNDDDDKVIKTTRSPIQANGIDGNVTCDELIQHFLHVNRAFHHQGAASISAPPLINYGFYKGQGFGRLVDHFTAHCLLSLALDRPCLLDLSARDEFYTWRAFINTGDYDWDMEKEELQPLVERVHTAIDALPNPQDGDWPQPVPNQENLHLLTKLDNWPRGKTNRAKYWQYIEPWRAEHISKPLLSPNWGSAWFPNLNPPAYYGACHRRELETRIQNVLFEPTQLSRKLHNMQQSKVIGDDPSSRRRPYGAIHLRFVILQVEKWFQGDDMALAEELNHALQRAYKLTNLTEWWLISDKPARAMALANQTMSLSSMGLFRIYMNPALQQAEGFTDHSNNIEARGLFGHASMAVSVADWMVLHESEAALITHGSYGGTGARGRGKIQRDDRLSLFLLHTKNPK